MIQSVLMNALQSINSVVLYTIVNIYFSRISHHDNKKREYAITTVNLILLRPINLDYGRPNDCGELVCNVEFWKGFLQ